MRPVQPVRPVAAWIGGKRLLAQRIVQQIEQVPHDLYCEAFLGMGGVFLKRRQAPPAEVINDLSRDVATLFRVLQRHYQAFLEMLRWQLTTRADFERLMATPPDTMTDLERSARFLYLQRCGFGGKVAIRTFGVNYTSGARFDVTRLVPLLEDVHSRLAGVVIECLPWGACIAKYDRPGTLFYLDPPYWGHERYYGVGFGREQFEVLADVLSRLQGRFILSLNDTPEVRRTFARFAIEAVQTTYSAGGGAASKAVREVLISPR
jgi:DNA adenine methylase